MVYDVIVIGGSFAGLAAALQVVRARRRVLIIDSGLRRNRFADQAHGILGQDGRAPGSIAEEAKAQWLSYPDAYWQDGVVKSATREGSLFAVVTKAEDQFAARRLVLASGVSDLLPDLPGLEERWGKSVFHCPYCHGYELNEGRLGVLATMPLSLHQADIVRDWGETFLLTGNTPIDDIEKLNELRNRGVVIEEEPVVGIFGDRTDLRLRDGRTLSLEGLFVLPHTQIHNPVPDQLGCDVEEGPTGPYLATDRTMETSAEGVFACGDIARPSGFVSTAIGDGALAGMAVHQSLLGVV